MLPEHAPALRVLAQATDVNAAGDVFGGWLMGQVDIAGAVAAVARAEGRVATVAVKDFAFLQPVKVGDLVSCYADVCATGHSSVTVRVDVFVQRPEPSHWKLQTLHVARGDLVYVALDARGGKRPLPPAGDERPPS